MSRVTHTKHLKHSVCRLLLLSLSLTSALLPSALLTACATPSVSLRQGTRAYTAADYTRIYERWTRDEENFAWGRMSDVLQVSATFESWEFRWAYTARYAQDYGVDTRTRAELLKATLEDAKQHHRFFITLAGINFRESNLTGHQAAWRVFLVGQNEEQTEPLEIQTIRRPTPADQVYFPTISSQRRTFRVLFPAIQDGKPTIAENATHITLRFTGPRGRVDLTWNLASP